MVENIVYLVLGLAALIFGGDSLVSGAKRVGVRLGVSSLVIGLTVVAFGTSAPELFISVQSALSGSPDIAMGNVVGSNICNLALVLGAATLVAPMPVHKDNIYINWPVTFAASLLLLFVVQDGLLVAWEGLIFIICLGVYLFTTFKYGEQPLDDDIPEVDKENARGILEGFSRDVAFIFLGGMALYFGSEWFVGGAKGIAEEFNVSERIIGITLVALGTSLPELVTSLIAAYKRDTDMALGGLLGSNIFNIFSILGITSLIQDIYVAPKIISSDLYWMLGITFLLFPMMVLQRRVSWQYAIVLLGIYVGYTYLVLA